VFAVHFLAYAERAVQTVLADWGATRRWAVAGTGVRGMLVVAAVGGGAVLGLSLLPAIDAWRGGR
jgi:hypothetical protein